MIYLKLFTLSIQLFVIKTIRIRGQIRGQCFSLIQYFDWHTHVWYLLPIATRRMFSMILAHTQQPVVFGGYAKASCTRDTFKKVFTVDIDFWLLEWNKHCISHSQLLFFYIRRWRWATRILWHFIKSIVDIFGPEATFDKLSHKI